MVTKKKNGLNEHRKGKKENTKYKENHSGDNFRGGVYEKKRLRNSVE